MTYRIKLIALYFIGASVLELIACFDCPQPTGTFEDPTDPRKFYECFDNRAFRSTCAANLVFDPDLGQCNFESEVHHNTTTSRSSTDQTVVITTQSPVFTSTVQRTSEDFLTTETLSVRTTEPQTDPPTQPSTPPTEPPTTPPTEPTTPPPTERPTEIPTSPPTEPSTQPPTEPSTQPPTEPSTQPPTTIPTEPTIVTTTPTTIAITADTTTIPSVVTTDNPNWTTFKTKMDGEMNHLSQYMTSVLRDAQPLIKDHKEESMKLMIASIIKQIGVILDLENMIKAELKEELTTEAKTYLNNTEQTLTSDKEKLNQLLIDLQRALDAGL